MIDYENIKNKLMSIILIEIEKDYKEMDSDLITECVNFLNEIEGNKTLTQEEIYKRIDKIPFIDV
jgi:hypothetical protein